MISSNDQTWWALRFVDEGTMDREPFEKMKAFRAGLS